jgi:hypothetical protein
MRRLNKSRVELPIPTTVKQRNENTYISKTETANIILHYTRRILQVWAVALRGKKRKYSLEGE